MAVLIAACMVAAGIGLTLYGLSLRLRSDRDSLSEILEVELSDPSSDPERLAALVARAGAFADRAMARTTWAGKVRLMLSQAGWTLRPGEFAALGAASAVATGLLAATAFGSVVGLAAAVVTPLATVAFLNARGKRRVRAIEEQLPLVLQLLAGSLDSGASILHAMELVVEEGDPPLATEFARVVAETRVGRPLLEALEGMAARAGSRDLEWTVEAIRIQHQTGGRLADTLRVLAEFMRARLEIRGEVRALSAEARLSARVLIALPFLVGGFFVLFRASYVEPLFTTGVGRMMLAVAAGGMFIGWLWMRRIVRVEV